MSVVQIQLPEKLKPVFLGDCRYRGAYGGRGSAKTRSFALMSAVRAYQYAYSGVSGVILCGREYMNSLEDSSMEEVKQSIRATPWLGQYFDIGEKYIRTKNGLVNYVFCGLRHNLDSIKSKARVLIAWVDEAENVSDIAWKKLIPTVREDDSEIWVTWNPENENSPTDKRFRKQPRKNSLIVEMNYVDNPWFPKVLEEERLEDLISLPYGEYAWIWEGAYREISNRSIFGEKLSVKSFEIDESFGDPLIGVDWGFSVDPTAALEVYEKGRDLYIRSACSKIHLEVRDTSGYLIKHIPNVLKYTSRADSARPEVISHVKQNISLMIACEKWKGSVEDGIAYIQSYDNIYVHPDCPENVMTELKKYSYKLDKDDEITAIPEDKNNHYADALRYALQPRIKRKGGFMFG
ncbi:PBSX family phage terminase large subunit [Neisseria sp. Ec49-e6-T10]|uniref:PBSX family phage terminase large subunit n=1 Tax=Neisseria sp. Ec49-e6-T10 TaxID=3140744 RepID=UPI003EB72470